MIETIAALAMTWQCLAETAYYEARGQSDRGQQAVVHVVLNRTRDSRYPSDVCEVTRQNNRVVYQFSWVGQGLGPMRDNKAMARAYVNAIIAWADHHQDGDFTKGATHFHATHVQPAWSRKLVRTAAIDAHRFYKYPNADEYIQDAPILSGMPAMMATFISAGNKMDLIPLPFERGVVVLNK